MRRILAWLLVCAMLMAMPGAIAEGERLHSISVNNIAIQYADNDPIEVDLGYELSYGARDLDELLRFVLRGNGNSIIDAQMAYVDEVMTLSLDGLKNHYRLTNDEGREMSKDSGSPEFDTNEIKELVQLFGKSIDEMFEAQRNGYGGKFGEIYVEMGYVQGADEEVMVNGQPMTLTRYDATLTPAQSMENMYALIRKMGPSMDIFWEKYFDLANRFVAASGSEERLDMDMLIETMYLGTGEGSNSRVTMWMDDEGRNVRTETLNTTTRPNTEGGDPIADTTLTIVETNTDDAGQHTNGELTMRSASGEQTQIPYSFNIALPDGGIKFDAKGTIETKDSSSRFVFDTEYDAQGKGTAYFSFDTEDTGNAFVSVESTGGDPNVHHVEWGINVVGDVPMNLVVASDLTTKSEPLPEAFFVDDGREIISIAKMTDEDNAALEREMTTKMIIIQGGLLQTNGVARLMTDLMSMATTAIENMMFTDDLYPAEGLVA